MALDWAEHPEAREELLDAHARYSQINDGTLGAQFLLEVEAAVSLIQQWPTGPPPLEDQDDPPSIRRLRLRKFPYLLIYTVDGDSILVLAYAHESRRPRYWYQRLV